LFKKRHGMDLNIYLDEGRNICFQTNFE